MEYYREGSQPDAFVGLPKEWDQEQILAFQRHFDAMLAGHAGMRRRVRFMPGDFSYRETKAPLLKDAYDEFLARIICFVFSVSPDVFTGHMNRATAQVSQGRAVEEGLVPLKRFVCEMMNRVIVEEFGAPDLEFVWVESNVQDPKDAAQVNVAYVGAGILTVDEVRAGLGLEALAKGAAWAGKHSAGTVKFNPYHVPAGSPDGGQFTDEGGAGDGDDDDYGLDDVLSDIESYLDDAVASRIDEALGVDGVQVASAEDDAPEGWGNPKTLQKHFNDHGEDFGAASPSDYVQKSQDFLQQGYEEKLPMIEYKGGQIGVYDPATNSFATYNSDGTTQTFYKPTSPTYFEREIQDTLADGGKVINPFLGEGGAIPGVSENSSTNLGASPKIPEIESPGGLTPKAINIDNLLNEGTMGGGGSSLPPGLRQHIEPID